MQGFLQEPQVICSILYVERVGAERGEGREEEERGERRGNKREERGKRGEETRENI
jgi:hypothetical protein